MGSGIYAVNTASGSTIAVNGIYPITSVVRKFGRCLSLAGNGISLNEVGYYDVDATVTVSGTATGTVTASLYMDGTPIVGATATGQISAVGDTVTLPLSTLARVRCNCADNRINVVIGGQAVTSQNLAVSVAKI